MGSVMLSLRRRTAASVRRALSDAASELGAGVPPEWLMVVEIVPDTAGHVRRAPPGVEVLCGDAFDLQRAPPTRRHGRVGTAICGIPLTPLPLPEQRRLVDAVRAEAPGRGVLLCPRSITKSLPHRKPGLAERRGAWTPWNLPPASVWRCWHDDVQALP
jgi:phosphatidylethanolamine/phosphatidyl-N-methylethanolamine N-methyltransferase